MTDRDRLIELIKQGENNTPCAENEDIDCTEINCGACVRGGIADYLLANGVIVLPNVKVGSEIYQISDNCRISKETITDITIILDRYEPPYIKCDTECKVCGYVYSSYFNCDLLGEKVFLTKEEAEEKLKECENNA